MPRIKTIANKLRGESDDAALNAYTPTAWENGKTKLNANNMNNIESGIGEAKTTAETATISAEYAITIANTKQDALISGRNIKTINGQSILGSGDLDGGLVDDVKVNGVSVVTNKIAEIAVPTKTSQLTNDGDGTSIFTTKTYVDSQVIAERDARIAADNQLAAALNTETSARKEKDIELNAAILAEKSERSSADLQLSTAISNEAVARSTKDAELEGKIGIETNDRINADAKLTSDLAAETSNRQAADNTLQTNINNEATTRATADSTLQSNIDTEKQERIATVSTLTDRVAAEETARAEADTTLQNNINSEKDARVAADNTLTGKISAEETARISADTALQTNIDAEASTRSTKDAELQGNITAEKNAREAADANLQTSITTEGTTRKNTDDKLTADLTTEVTNRTDADTALGNRIDTETSNRTTADTTLQNNINALSGDVTSGLALKLDKSQVTDSVISTSTTDALSANQGKLLNDRINNLESIGRFLSVWNCVTGKPETDPQTLPYAYRTGDYYRVGTVGTTNYKPDGSEYTGAASTKVATETNIALGDIWYYDSNVWALQKNHIGGFVEDVHVDGTSIVSGGVAKFISGTNVKTINGNSVFGSGNLDTLDTDVKLSSELKTYYNIGKVQDASGTHPVVIGNAGDTLRQVLNNLTQMDEVQPTITSTPDITSLAFSANAASDEYGTEINEIDYSLTTVQGSYTYQPKPTGVTWSKYNFSGGCAAIDKTATTGKLTLTSTYTVGASSAVSFTCKGSHTAGGVAKTNLGNDSNPTIQIAAGDVTKTGSFNKAVVAYPYYVSSTSTSAPTSGTKADTKLESATGATIPYVAQNYLWILSTNNTTAKKIQIYSDLTKSWSDMLGGTQAGIQVTFTMANGKTRTYYAYRTTNISQSSGSALIRFN